MAKKADLPPVPEIDGMVMQSIKWTIMPWTGTFRRLFNKLCPQSWHRRLLVITLLF
jgi:hypothetical protein